jgi:predicted metal-dependent hydrolase
VTRPADSIPLPAWRHIPGVSARHADDAFDAIKALCPSRVTDEGAAANDAWAYGLRLFNHGYYWEAHEVLETVWMRAAPNSRERALVRALIHLANGALKLAAGKPAAASRLAALATESVAASHAGGRHRVMGLAADELLAIARSLAEGDPRERMLEARYAI